MAEFDDLIKQYTKDGKSSSKTTTSAVPNGEYADIINQYVKTKDEPKVVGAAPTGYNAATGETSYNKPSEVAIGSHTPSIVKDTAVNAARAVGTGLFNAGVEAGSGLREALSGQPASGIGKIGMAPLTAIGALTSDPLSSVAGDITGSPNIAARAGALPLPLPVVGAGKALNVARPANKAFKNLVESIGPENAGAVAAEMRTNPRLTPADLSPSVLQDAQNLFTKEGKHIDYMSNTIQGSRDTANAAVNAAMDTSLGGRVNPVAKLDELKTNIVNAGKQAIEPALVKTKPVDLSPVVKHIDNILKPGVMQIIENPENLLPYNRVQQTLQKWRDFMTNDKLVLTDPNELNKLQSGIRRQAEGLLKTGDAEAKATGHALYSLRNEIINAIGKAGPQTTDKAGNAISEYRLGLSKYRDENDVADAFRHGHDAIIKNGRGLEDNPEFFKQWVDNASDLEKEAAKQGAGIAIRTAMNAYRSPVTNPTSKAQQMAQIDFNRQRIEALFGKEDAGRLFKTLDQERAIAERGVKIAEGSQTAMRARRAAKFEMPTASDLGKGLIPPAIMETAGSFAGAPGLASGTYAVARTAAFVKDKIANAMQREHNLQYAKYALPTEGPSREQLIRQLEGVAADYARKQSPRLSVGSKARLALPTISP